MNQILSYLICGFNVFSMIVSPNESSWGSSDFRFCGMCMFVCMWGACACRVWGLRVAGAVVVVQEPGGAVKGGNELCFISFFLWRNRAKKDSNSASEIEEEGLCACVCVCGSNNFSSSFWLFPHVIFGPIHVNDFLFLLFMSFCLRVLETNSGQQ